MPTPKSSLQDLSRSKNLKITKVAGSRLATVVSGDGKLAGPARCSMWEETPVVRSECTLPCSRMGSRLDHSLDGTCQRC